MPGVKNLAKHSVIYGLGSVSGQFVHVILLPVYAQFLTSADFGVLGLLLLTTQVVRGVCNCGMMHPITRQVSLKKDPQSVVATTALAFLLVVAVVVYAILAAFASGISDIVLKTPDYETLFLLLFLSGFLRTPRIVVNTLLRLEKKSALFSFISFGRISCSLILNIVFVAGFRLGVYGIVLAHVVTDIVFAVVYIGVLIPRLRPGLRVSMPILKELLIVGLPLMPNSLIYKTMTSADRLFLVYYATLAEVGLYSIGYRFSAVIAIGLAAVKMAWPVHMFELASKRDGPQQLARHLTYYVAFFALLGLALSLVARDALLILMGPEFQQAALVVPLIAASYVLFGMRSMINVGILTQGKTYYLPIFLVGAAIANLALNYLLVPRYGMMGAAWATLSSFAALLAVQWMVNLRLWYFSYEYGRLLKILGAVAAVAVTGLFLPELPVVGSLAARCSLLILYPVVLWALRFFTSDELAKIRQMARSGCHRLRIGKASESVSGFLKD